LQTAADAARSSSATRRTGGRTVARRARSRGPAAGARAEGTRRAVCPAPVAAPGRALAPPKQPCAACAAGIGEGLVSARRRAAARRERFRAAAGCCRARKTPSRAGHVGPTTCARGGLRTTGE
jgi:hypothetical protein